jgi:antitoxin (DNA-binding transcriptional repressor) of toxin-antitoxin stability system
MVAKATVRELRNQFPKVRKLVEEQGEVVVTDQGEPRYRLVLYTPAVSTRVKRRKDYLARLRRYQPRPLSAAASKALDDENRGSR